MKPQDDARFLELLDRWVRGDFTRADERELRALAAGDAFRQEAWDGLLVLPEADHAARLAALRVRLLGARPPGRVVAFPQLLAAAAAVAALLIAAVFFLPKWIGKTDGPVAATQTEGTPPNPELPTGATSAPDLAATEAAPKPNLRPSEPADSRAKTAAPEAPGDMAYAEEAPPQPSEQKLDDDLRDDERAGGGPADKALSKPETAQQPAASGAPPPGAPGRSARTETAKKEKKQPSKATQPASPAARPTDSTRWFDTDTRPDVETMREEARKQALPEKPRPRDGWDAFDEYLRQNAQLTPEARNNNVSGIVRIQFSVNANGEPFNFQTLKSLGHGCDQEAVRLIQNYEWEPGREPVVVEVRFAR